ncbi:copper resistance CopC family protein [Rhodococcus ruber]|uniref:copper resistance CopC family protein n=1 Tax=Rhodococcus ruber TaxID=1830 RepID=UPI0026604521|nr:copper resistance CopC family protein [Rhodococcus ruber]MDO1482087.1 copper resistance protein CopC [Rhodococcus ruber]
MRNLVAVVAVAVSMLLLGAGPVQAHSALIGSTPAADAVLEASPDRIEPQFNQPINASFATVTVTDEDGTQRGGSRVDVTGDGVQVAVLEPLTPGGYTVGYRVVSADGHPITGSYTFTVTAAAAAAAVPSAATSPAPSATAAGEASSAAVDDVRPGPSSLWLLLGGVVAVLAIAGLTWAALRAFRKG